MDRLYILDMPLSILQAGWTSVWLWVCK